MSGIKFTKNKTIKDKLGRAGILSTPHGDIQTPSFVIVGTKATVRAVSPEQVLALDAQVVLANTYHLYLQPGEQILKNSGKLRKFMHWKGPTMTDSGGFQAFSLGVAFGENVSKIAKGEDRRGNLADDEELKKFTQKQSLQKQSTLAKIDEEGITFKSHLDGSEHRFTPERSIEIQHNIGADMIFAFDECTSPHASYEYQKEAMNRTHRWAERSLCHHNKLLLENKEKRALFGIVQGGRFEDLRKESARVISEMGFDGFGIGGSFDKEDMDTVVGWVNNILPEDKPRHLLGIGEPMDLFGGVENGCDLFDCVAPTRMARNGTLYTKQGRININNSQFTSDFTPIEKECECYACKNYTRAYLAHLFRAKEMFAATLASIHNLYFINHLVKNIRQSILDGNFFDYKNDFIAQYYNKI